MRNHRASRLVIFLWVLSAVALGAPLTAQEKARQRAPLFESSFEDKAWRNAQAAARPWTREEMMSAIPDDVPGVNDGTLQQWAAEDASVYNTTGGPGFLPGGGPGGQVTAGSEEPLILRDAAAAGPLDKGYSYPAPFTRYEAFPSYTIYPYQTVGKVFFTKPGIGNFVCSASSIGGDGVITAGHCVHDSATSTFWSNWVFVPAYKNGAAPFGQWTADHLWIRGGYANGGNGDNRFDIGGAVLTRKAGLKISQKVGFLGFTWNTSNTDIGAHWAILGYPQAAPFTGKFLYVCQTSFAYTAGGSAPSPIGAGCDQSGGTSGGPWIRAFSGAAGATNYVNGVNSYRRCFDAACNNLYVYELFSPYFDTNAKGFRDCIVNSVPGNPADPAHACAPGT